MSDGKCGEERQGSTARLRSALACVIYSARHGSGPRGDLAQRCRAAHLAGLVLQMHVEVAVWTRGW